MLRRRSDNAIGDASPNLCSHVPSHFTCPSICAVLRISVIQSFAKRACILARRGPYITVQEVKSFCRDVQILPDYYAHIKASIAPIVKFVIAF